MLTAQQQRFVDEYLVDLNATQAAIRAGYAHRTARQQGQRLLTHVDIASAIQAAKNEREKRTHITQDRVLLEIARLGLSDIRSVFTENGMLRPVHELDDAVAAAIASVKVVTRPGADVDKNGNREIEYVHEIKFWDKNSAIDKLIKHMGKLMRGDQEREKSAEEVTHEERIQRYAALAARAEAEGDHQATLHAEDSLTKVAGLFTGDRQNARSPLEDLTPHQRQMVGSAVKAAIEKAETDAKTESKA